MLTFDNLILTYRHNLLTNNKVPALIHRPSNPDLVFVPFTICDPNWLVPDPGKLKCCNAGSASGMYQPPCKIDSKKLM